MPDFTEQYTANEAKYATTPAALPGFQRLQEGFEKGWYQEDFASTTHDDGLGMLARARSPTIRCSASSLGDEADNPGPLEKIGFFAQPSDSAANNGATIWMPAAHLHRRERASTRRPPRSSSRGSPRSRAPRT